MGDRLLPPLPPNTGQKANIPSTNQQTFRFEDIQEQSAFQKEDEEIFQNHLMRVQETLIDSVDSRLIEAKERLRNAELNYKQAQKDQIDAGVSLYRAQKNIGHLNRNLSHTREQLEKTTGETKVIHRKWESAEEALEESNQDKMDLEKQLKDSKEKLEEASAKILQLTQINQGYTSEIKIQKRINSKLKKEVEFVTTKFKDMEYSLESEKDKVEMLELTKKTLTENLAQQQVEVKTSQTAINSLRKEIKELTKLKESSEKQWEEALIAMSGRDKSIFHVEKAKAAIETKLLEAQAIRESFATDNQELEKSLSIREKDNEKLFTLTTELQTQLKNVLAERDEALHALNNYKLQAKERDEVITKLESTVADMENTIEKKNQSISALKSELTSCKADYKEAMRFHVSIDQAYRREDEVQEKAQTEIKKVLREEESKFIEIRRENAMLKLKIEEQRTSFDNLSKNYEILDKQYRELNDHYSKLHEEARHMEYDSQRKEHDLNLFRAKASEDEDSHKQLMKALVAKLKSDLEACSLEKDRIHALWLEAQNNALNQQSRYQALLKENELLQTKLGTADGVKQKTETIMDGIKVESLEHKWEAAKLGNELKKLQITVESLKNDKSLLEHKLRESTLKLEEAYINSMTSKQMLRTEIRRLSQDKTNLKQDKSQQEHILSNAEKDRQLSKEMIEKLKSERYELSRQVYTLKKRADESERKYYDAKLKIRQYERIEAKKVASAKSKSLGSSMSSDIPLAAEAPPKQSTQPKTHPSREKLLEVPDFDSMRLKIESLELEKQFLFGENTTLKETSAQLTSKAGTLQHKLDKAMEEITKKEQLIKHNSETITTMELQYQRAKKVAAHIEKQMKVRSD